VKSLKNLCNHCPYGKTRETCTELCPEAQAYADQDYVGEEVFKIPAPRNWQFRVPVSPEDKAREIRRLHKKGYNLEEISIQIECDISFIQEILENDKQRIC